MESSQKNPVLHVKQEELIWLRQQYGISDEKKVKEDISLIRDWLKKESHLVEASEYLNDNIIERMYFGAKGSVEITKIKIDNFLTSRGLSSEICMNKNIDEFDYVSTKIQYIVLPNLNPMDNTRVQVLRYLSSDLDDVSLLSMYRYISLLRSSWHCDTVSAIMAINTLPKYRDLNKSLNAVIDYMQSVESNFGVRTVVDFTNFPISFFLKINPMMVKKMETLSSKGYGLKMKGIHLINIPNFIDKILVFLKSTLSEKVSGRVFVHSTCEDLHKEIAKEILPKEYGGDGPSCSEIADKWKQTLKSEDARKIIANSEKLITDETKRSSCKFNEEYLGMPGTFRTLNVD